MKNLCRVCGIGLIFFLVSCRCSDPAPPPPPPNHAAFSVDRVEAELLKRNIVLTENPSETADVRGWIIDDPAYIQLTKVLLKLLKDRRVVDKIPLNVINGRYKNLHGVEPAGYLAPEQYEPGPELEQAIYQTFMERHRNQFPDAASFNDIVAGLSPEPVSVGTTTESPTDISVKTDGGYVSACGSTFAWSDFSQVINNPIGGNLPDLQYKMFFQSRGISSGILPSAQVCPNVNAPAQCWPQDVTAVRGDGSFELLFYKRQSNNRYHRFVLTFEMGSSSTECSFTVQ